MRSKPLVPLLLAVGTAGGLLATSSADARLRYVTDADAPRALAQAGPVDVRWDDPANFAEIRYSANRIESRRGDWVEQLARHVRDHATPRLAAGERLEVTITDVDLAGDFEPWRGPQFMDTRFLRDIYPPRISLHFTRLDANGAVVAQGERNLRDPGYLIGTSLVSSEPLKYEKRMLERWLVRELPSRRVSSR
jgi:hypothetical protein